MLPSPSGTWELFVADDVLRIADGEFVFRISDSKVGNLQGAVLEISEAGALVASRQRVDATAYETVLDVTIELKGHLSRQFFASVVAAEPEGLRLAWLNIDPGQQSRLKVLVDAYKARQVQKPAAPVATEGGHKTRRLVKPSVSLTAPAPAVVLPPKPAGGMVITPFGADTTPMGTSILPSREAPGPIDIESSGTRRVIKPKTQTIDLFGGGDIAAGPLPPASPKVEARRRSVTEVREEEAEVEDAAISGKTVVGQDGRMDIGATLRSKARTISASELASRHDKVRVLNLATIRTLIQEAVEEAASHLTRALGEAERKRLLEEAEEGFQERMKAFQMEMASADEKSKQLADQLFKAQKLLGEERKRSISADQFTVSSAGLEEIENAFSRVIDRSVVDGKLTSDLEAELRKLTAHVLDSERQRIREKEMGAQNDKIALLEKKIQRLAGNLEETEKQRDEAREIAQALEQSAGQGLSMEQIKQKFQIGLSKNDPRREQKLAVMKELLEQNRELRRKLGLATNQEAAAEADIKSKAIAADVNAAGDAIMPDGTPAPVEAAATDASDPPSSNPDDEVWNPDPAEPAEPAINPDDLPWEPPAASGPVADSQDERGVKVMRNFKKFEPPPLQGK